MRLLSLSLLTVLAAGVATAWATGPGQVAEQGGGAPAAAPEPRIPMQFVANAGQWADEVAFAAIGECAASWVFADGFAQRFERWLPVDKTTAQRPPGCEGAVVRTRFLQAAGIARGEEPQPAAFHFLRGTAATAASAFARVRVHELLPGVDLVLRSLPREAGHHGIEYDLQLAAGVDLGSVTAVCEGVQSLSIDGDGALCLTVALPSAEVVTLRQLPPVGWQDGPAGRQAIAVSFRLLAGNRYGFAAPGRDLDLPTTIDPGIVWSTLLGGSGSDSVNDVCWRPGQGLWVGGWASATDFPTTVGAFRTAGSLDGFVARMAEDGTSLIWATYLGGSRSEEVRGLAVDNAGNVTAVGWTRSIDFPVVSGAFQPTYAGASPVVDFGDAFCVRLSATGAGLLGGTYLGGSFDDAAEGVDLAANGEPIVVGWSSSLNFPTTLGSFQPAFGGLPNLQPDGFVARVALDGRTLVYSTYLGGFISDQLLDVKVNAADQATVVGHSVSPNYPTTPAAFSTALAGLQEMVVTRLNAAGSGLIWSTFLGGQDPDEGLCLELAADGSVWVGGWTASTNFPTTTGALQSVLNGRHDGVVAQLSGNGQSLLFATLLGGSGDDAVRGITLQPAGPVVVGETEGGFPVTTGAPQTSFGGGALDGFVAQLVAGGAFLGFSTYLGGSGDEFLHAIKGSAAGLATIGGSTFAPDFPTTPGVVQTQRRGSEDGVVVRLDLRSLLEGALRVATGGPVPKRCFTPGEVVDSVSLRLENGTPRVLSPESVRILVGGSADARSDLEGVSIWIDDPAVPGLRDQFLVGPVPLTLDNAEVTVPLTALPPLPPATSRLLTVVLHTRTGTLRGAELACAVVGDDRWQVRAEGAGGGPPVTVSGSQRIAGPVQAAIEERRFPGDVDGDGHLTVADVRRMCLLLDQPAPPALDPDGDGRITGRDVDSLRDVLFERAVLLGFPSVWSRGAWITLRGWFPEELPGVTLGGRVLALGTVTTDELCFRLDADQPLGSQDLTIAYASGRTFTRRVDVQ